MAARTLSPKEARRSLERYEAKQAAIAKAEDRLMNAAARSRALAEAVVGLSILTNTGDDEIDAIAATLQTKLDAALADRTAAVAELKAARQS